MDAVDFSNLIVDYVSAFKTALTGVEGLLLVVVTVVVTAKKLAELLSSKKAYL